MTAEQEQSKLQEYKKRIDKALQEEQYSELARICKEDDCLFLSSRDRDLTLLRRIMRIWELEQGRAPSETIIGRTAAFCEESLSEVTGKQLIDVYTILRFALFRIDSGLPEEIQTEGVLRVMALGLSPGAILLTAEIEVENSRRIVGRFAELLESPALLEAFPGSSVTAAILRGAIADRKEA